jgi:ABC-2 type transport system permease protein
MGMYIQTIKITFKNSIVYRFNTIVSILATIFTLSLQILLWKSLLTYRTDTIITLEQMIVYQTAGIVLGLLYNASVADEVGNKIKDGSISFNLMKPYYFSGFMIAHSIGNSIFDFLVKGTVVTIVAYFFYGFHITVESIHVFLFCLVVCLNFFLFWLMNYIIGLLHFILLSANWFTRILRDTITISSGAIIPLWFFPGGLREIALFLPFQLLYQFPLSLLTGKITPNEIIRNFLFEFFWIGVLSFVAYLLWKQGIKKLVIQGG